MGIFTVIPLMIIPVLIYNVIAFGSAALSTAEGVRARMDEGIYVDPYG